MNPSLEGSESLAEHAARGDHPTPPLLCSEVCGLLQREGVVPRSVVEPTCGDGAFLKAALERFPSLTKALGFDLWGRHVQTARERFAGDHRVVVEQGNVFDMDWCRVLADLPAPILVLGNPPWVTTSALGVVNSKNRPAQTRRLGLSGIEARTGRGHYDVSEWIARTLIGALGGRGHVALLMKSSASRGLVSVGSSPLSFYGVDVQRHFKVSVAAGLLVSGLGGRPGSCRVFYDLASWEPERVWAWHDDRLVSDEALWEKRRPLMASKKQRLWRSGLKHDCKKVFELSSTQWGLLNGSGDIVRAEDEVLFPFMKSSDVIHERLPSRRVLVTQQSLKDDPGRLKASAPRAWDYLRSHHALLSCRRSSIYKNRHPYSIFGVGPYSFAPWKIAISGLSKKLGFAVVGPFQGKPVLFDDTVAFLPCESEQQARDQASLLRSAPAREFFGAQMFLDAKRPITSELLNSLDIKLLAQLSL